MDPRLTLLLALLSGASGRIERRFSRDIDDIPNFILPHTFFSGSGASGPNTHHRQEVLQWLHDRLRGEDGSRAARLDVVLPLLLTLVSQQTSGQAAAIPAPTGTAPVPSAAPAGIDPTALLLLFLLLRPGNDDH
jgi:hypothetical protein